MRPHRGTRPGVKRWLIGVGIAALPLPAVAALNPSLPPWAAYACFAIAAMVVIVLLLHEVLDEDDGVDRPRESKADVSDSARKRYAAQRASDQAASIRRIV